HTGENAPSTPGWRAAKQWRSGTRCVPGGVNMARSSSGTAAHANHRARFGRCMLAGVVLAAVATPLVSVVVGARPAQADTATATVGAGTGPQAVAVNPVTNKVYVANKGSANVTVIDGATNATTTVGAGTNPQAVAVDPVTNEVYVANNGSNDVTVIDGATNA